MSKKFKLKPYLNFLITILVGLVIFNIVYGNNIATMYINDTIYATDYIGVTLILVAIVIGLVVAFSVVKFAIRKIKNFGVCAE